MRRFQRFAVFGFLIVWGASLAGGHSIVPMQEMEVSADGLRAGCGKLSLRFACPCTGDAEATVVDMDEFESDPECLDRSMRSIPVQADSPVSGASSAPLADRRPSTLVGTVVLLI